jgi:homospermidine synthase
LVPSYPFKKHACWHLTTLATSLQIASGILGAIVRCIENPTRGIIKPEDIDHHSVLEVTTPYLGVLSGTYTNWTPLERRNFPFPEKNIDESDPWQFKNFRCTNVSSNWKPIRKQQN